MRRVSLDSWSLTDAERGVNGDMKRVMQDTPTPPMEQVRPGAGVRGYTITPNGNLVRRRRP